VRLGGTRNLRVEKFQKRVLYLAGSNEVDVMAVDAPMEKDDSSRKRKTVHSSGSAEDKLFMELLQENRLN
jgi:hypothetical protein